MKSKHLVTGILAFSMILALAGCSADKGSSAQSSSSVQSSSSAKSGSTMEERDSAIINGSDDTSSAASKIDDLYAKENQIFSDHQDVWNKVFGLMSKDTAESNQEMEYADFLENTINSNKDSFTEDELKTLEEDIKTIREIEKQIAELGDPSVGTNSAAPSSESTGTFSNIKGKDLDGNDVDSSIFSKSAVTVVNFWFNGCKPCIAELTDLDKLNKELESMGGQVIGINSETLNGDQAGIEEAKKILKEQGTSYKNIYFDDTTDAGAYTRNILAFPTTVLVDRNGNIVGEPLLGGIDKQENYDSLMAQIKQVIEADK